MSTLKREPPRTICDSPCRKDIACTQLMCQLSLLDTQPLVPMKAAPIVSPRESEIGAIWGREVDEGGRRAHLSLERLATLCMFSLTGLICAGPRR